MGPRAGTESGAESEYPTVPGENENSEIVFAEDLLGFLIQIISLFFSLLIGTAKGPQGARETPRAAMNRA